MLKDYFSRASGVVLEMEVCQSVGPPLWSRPKYLNNYRKNYNEILYRYSWSSEDEF